MKQTDIAAELDGDGISLITAKQVKRKLGIVSAKKADGWFSEPPRQGGETKDD